jgi:hypothetical protein
MAGDRRATVGSRQNANGKAGLRLLGSAFRFYGTSGEAAIDAAPGGQGPVGKAEKHRPKWPSGAVSAVPRVWYGLLSPYNLYCQLAT